MKTVVTISRKWNNPQIQHTLSGEGIAIEINLDDFITAIKEEVGSLTWTFRKQTFEKQLDEAVRAVIEEIKRETIKVI
jgi:hypothetical protein